MQLIIGQGYDIDEANAGSFGRLGEVVTLTGVEISVLILQSAFLPRETQDQFHWVRNLIVSVSFICIILRLESCILHRVFFLSPISFLLES